MTTPDVPSAEAQAIATRIMLNLTGRRWTWPMKQVLEEYTIGTSVDRVNLVGRPVQSVVSAVDTAGNVYPFELADSFRLRFPTLRPWDGISPWPNFDANGGIYPTPYVRRAVRMQVTYVYGCPPPVDVQRAINELAEQLDLAQANDPACKLPERVTSISREGVSWTILDPQQFLVGGKLGLYYPDLIISTYGGPNRVQARAKVYSPEYSPPRRLSSMIVPGVVTVNPS